MKSKHRYEIRSGKGSPCELWSVVVAFSFGKEREISNYVCEGTHTYCQRIKDQLENKVV